MTDQSVIVNIDSHQAHAAVTKRYFTLLDRTAMTGINAPRRTPDRSGQRPQIAGHGYCSAKRRSASRVEAMNSIPVIDIAALVKGSPEEARATAQALGAACRDVGFFYVSGHGVPPDLIARVFAMSAGFFAAPAAIRAAASFSGPGGNRGYIRLGGETLDPGKPADVKEAFNIGLELAPDDPELLARAPFRAANLWPDTPGFRDTMLDYFDQVWRLGRDLHRGFALDLGLECDFFETKLDKPIATLRLLHYPPVAGPLPDGQLGAGAHTDY